MTKRFPLTMERDLYRRIVMQAKREERNVNQQVRYMCTWYLDRVADAEEPPHVDQTEQTDATSQPCDPGVLPGVASPGDVAD